MHESASSIFGPTFGLALYGVGHALPFDLKAVVPIALVNLRLAPPGATARGRDRLGG
jgi:hypothetical protein